MSYYLKHSSIFLRTNSHITRDACGVVTDETAAGAPAYHAQASTLAARRDDTLSAILGSRIGSTLLGRDAALGSASELQSELGARRATGRAAGSVGGESVAADAARQLVQPATRRGGAGGAAQLAKEKKGKKKKGKKKGHL